MSTLGSPIPREPLVDATGRMTPTWIRWFYDLYIRVGGATAPTIPDLSVDMPEDAGIEELRQALFRSQDAAGQAPPVINLPEQDLLTSRCEHVQVEFLEMQVRQLAEEVARLHKEIDGIRQGTEL